MIYLKAEVERFFIRRIFGEESNYKKLIAKEAEKEMAF